MTMMIFSMIALHYVLLFIVSGCHGFSIHGPLHKIERSCGGRRFGSGRTSGPPFPAARRVHGALHQSRDWIDEVNEDELLEPLDGPPVKPDMKYLPRNVMRQNKNFVAIREAAGKELTNDVYVHEPKSSVFWFVGKIARVSDVSPAQAVSRQWNLIETHAAHLRPIELFPSRASLDIWIAPGDSEMDVAYNRPDVVMEKMNREVEGADGLKSMLMGFQGEMYEGGEEGFRTLRNDDGTPVMPEIQSPSQEDLRAPTESEMADIQKQLEGQDINELYKEQQRREGKSVDDD